MFEVKVNDHIAASHQLLGYDGPCAHLHGHTWKVEVVVAGDHLNPMGMLVDFKVLKMKLQEVLQPLDHRHLNDVPAFKDIHPTTENLARHIYRAFKEICRPFVLKQVQVWESETASVVYYE